MIIMKKFYTILFVLMTFFSATSQVFITELADPNNNLNARYIELYNAGQSDVDLSSYRIDKYTNASTTVSNTLNLTGIISAGGFYIIATGPEDTVMFDVYGVTPDQWDTGSNHVAGGNGDDPIELYDGTNTLIDRFGVPGTDGTGTCAEFEDGRAERKSSVSSGASTWDESEWNIWADSSVSGCTSHTKATQDAPGAFDPGSWIGAVSSATISVGSDVSGLDYFEGSGPSSEGSFSVDGINLTEDITVSAPTNFELSLTSGGTFASSVTLTQSSGTASGTVYVRLASGLTPDSYAGNVTIASSGADSKTVALSGTVTATDPQITVTAFLDDLNYVVSVGGPSAEDTFTISGLFLDADISVTAPSNFEVSLTSGQDFSGSVTISTPQDGTVASTTVYVRLAAGLTAGNYTGDITVSTTGATDQTIAVEGNAYGPPTNSLVITGIIDGPLSGGTPKAIELYVLDDIQDLSLYGVSSITNGAGSSAGTIEYSFPADAVTAGTYIYLSSATDDTNFQAFFGFASTYQHGVLGVNGDDSIELYENGQIIDTFGDVNTDGTGQAWDYLDGWAYRNSATGPEGTTFTPSNWTYSGANALDGETTNAGATTSMPARTYSETASVIKFDNTEIYVYPNPVKADLNFIGLKGTVRASVYDVTGRLFFQKEVNSSLDVSSLKAGIYIVKIENESGLNIFNIIKD